MTDVSLVRFVYEELYYQYEIRAMLTRFGDLAVFVRDAEYKLVYQCGNVLEARSEVDRLLTPTDD